VLDHAITRRRIVLILENILVFVAAACMYPAIARNQRLWADILRFFEENTIELDALKRAGHAKRGTGSRGVSKPCEPPKGVPLPEQKAVYQHREGNRAIDILNK
jgi:hypothetical protein